MINITIRQLCCPEIKKGCADFRNTAIHRSTYLTNYSCIHGELLSVFHIQTKKIFGSSLIIEPLNQLVCRINYKLVNFIYKK